MQSKFFQLGFHHHYATEANHIFDVELHSISNTSVYFYSNLLIFSKKANFDFKLLFKKYQ